MPWSFVAEQLTQALNYWVVTVGRGERPHAAPVWGVFSGDDLLLETSPSTRKAPNLARNPSVVVHTESAEQVVIVEGTAVPFGPPPEISERLCRAFAAKYEGYEPDPAEWTEGALFRIVPSVVFAWRDMPTATCRRFR